MLPRTPSFAAKGYPWIRAPLVNSRYTGMQKSSHLAGRHLALTAPWSKHLVDAAIPSEVFAANPNAPINGDTINPTAPLATPLAKPTTELVVDRPAFAPLIGFPSRPATPWTTVWLKNSLPWASPPMAWCNYSFDLPQALVLIGLMYIEK